MRTALGRATGGHSSELCPLEVDNCQRSGIRIGEVEANARDGVAITGEAVIEITALEDAELVEEAAAEGVPFAADCEGGMFGFFLLPQLPQNYKTVMTSDGARFNTLFHGLLDRGVYIAPALYEAGFVSAAHTDDDIATTVAAAREVFKKLAV